MSEKITWTHVDAHVRRELDDRGTLAFGNTDAEVAMGYIAFLERTLRTKEQVCVQLSVQAHRAESELARVTSAPKAKTKQRLEALEKQIEELALHVGFPL